MTCHRLTAPQRSLGPIAVTAAALMLAAPAQAQAPITIQILEAVNQRPTPITECMEIDQPGSYQVVQNLDAAGDCLLVTADDVTIDLGGFTLTGDGNGAGVTDGGTSRTNVAVVRGTVMGFERGMDLTETDAATVGHLRAVANGLVGIIVGPGSTVSASTASDNGSEGIRAASTSTVAGNTVIGNGAVGVNTLFDSTVSANTVSGNGTVGINARSGSAVVRNTVAMNGGIGILCGNGCRVAANTARGNEVGVTAGAGSTVAGNTVRSSEVSGIFVSCPSNVFDNTATDNVGNDLDLQGTGCNVANNLPASP